MAPKVSVILGVFNCQRYIRSAIESVLRQTFHDFELIIVDDASTDETVNCVEAFRDRRIHFIRHKTNRGPGAARNTAFDVAEGEWGALIDADDLWHSKRLAKLLEIAQSRLSAFFADDLLMCLSGKDDKLIPWRTRFRQVGLVINTPVYRIEPDEFVTRSLGVVKPIFPMDLVRRYNIRHREDVLNGEDIEFRMQLFKYGLKLYLLDEPLYFYRITDSALSANPNRWQDELIVYRDMLNDDGYSNEIRDALENKRIEIAQYAPFAAALKECNFSEAFKLMLKSPWLAARLLGKLPEWCSRRWLAFKTKGTFR